MLFLVGLGLGDAKDITVKGLEIVKKAKTVYLEAYTSILTVGKDALEEYYGREVILADREMVEQHSDDMLKEAKSEDIVFLVVGDPFGGRHIYEPPRYMTVSQAASQLLEIIEKKRSEGQENLSLIEDTMCVGVARVGADDQNIMAGTLKQMVNTDLGAPLHSLVIAGHMHPLEIDMLRLFAVDKNNFDELVKKHHVL
ncbi:diphthine methyl ester synthase-like [Saccoglossus kowalevskii]|uniref:diphthine methyl ester synthase n=1 Tax=Saccoglossus kowalevskii TaxID=10224 RepID=A0ABM0MIW6_SACKO|nr:PREDICTED: diphthine synthase-like [Saccoglossus kowalevskii]